jgi:hypothetical protein
VAWRISGRVYLNLIRKTYVGIIAHESLVGGGSRSVKVTHGLEQAEICGLVGVGKS